MWLHLYINKKTQNNYTVLPLYLKFYLPSVLVKRVSKPATAPGKKTQTVSLIITYYSTERTYSCYLIWNCLARVDDITWMHLSLCQGWPLAVSPPPLFVHWSIQCLHPHPAISHSCYPLPITPYLSLYIPTQVVVVLKSQVVTMYTALTDILPNVSKGVSWLKLVFNFASHGCFIHTTRDNHSCLSKWTCRSNLHKTSAWSAYKGWANVAWPHFNIAI